MPNALQRFLNSPMIAHVRRNHGLEHATIHVVSQRHPHTSFIGRSDLRGFYIYGDISTQALQDSVLEALTRMRRGEHQLSIHENCGTNYLTAAVMVALAAYLSLMGSGKDERPFDRLLRLPMAIVAAAFALILAKPLGTAFQQRLTTSGDPGPLEVTSIRRLSYGRATVHRILTRS
jgi:hypothetical protein